MTRTGSTRSYDESCALLDGIVGRCVRDREFAKRVLADPTEALGEYELSADEIEDFEILRASHLSEANEVWTAIRARMGKLRTARRD